MDLRRQSPRSPRESLAGYVHLPRMLDKCRATIHGTQGEYVYPCPMDQLLLDFTGITAGQLKEAAKSYSSDEDMAEWFQSVSVPHSEAEVAEFNEMLLRRGPDTPEKQASFKKTRETIDPSRSDITSWADLLDLEEGRAVPRRQ
ncbi:MAG: DUF5069 domain-containing protein [Nitrospira sp.]